MVKEKESKILEDYENPKVGVADIIKTYKISHSQLQVLLARNNVPKRNRKQRNSKSRMAVKMFQEGQKQIAIAKKLGISRQAVHFAINYYVANKAA